MNSAISCQNRRPSPSAGFERHNFSSNLCDGLLDRSREAQDPALFRPRHRQIAHSLQPGSGQFRGLATGKDGLDDVGREKAEWQNSADIALIDAKTFGEITDRLRIAAPDLSEPMSALRNRCDELRVGRRYR